VGRAIVGLITNCKSFSVLPRAGGVLDQDSFFIHMLGVYENAKAEREALDEKRRASRAKHRNVY
jgi:hypothetical protein